VRRKKMLSLWEELLILRAKWEERIERPSDGMFRSIDRLKQAHAELDEIIKRHTRTKAPLETQSR
jgi:hypothetical protein